MNSNFYQRKILVSVFFLAIAFPLFYNLGNTTLMLWDESHVASNSIEMYGNGNYITSYYAGKPDMVNIKPPLLVWMQLISMHIFGCNEYAIRFPSALAALLTVLLMIFVVTKISKDKLPAVISSFVLITSFGYMYAHGARSGDYDALLTLCTTAALFFFYLSFHALKFNPYYFYAGCFAVFLAVLTKGIQGLIFIPALIFYFIYENRFVQLKINFKMLIFVFSLVTVLCLYFIFREKDTPGYIRNVLFIDCFRYFRTIDGHKHDLLFYFRNICSERFQPWIFFLLLSWIFLAYRKFRTSAAYSRFVVYLSVMSVFYLLVVSCSQTRLEWYDMPVYPLFAVISSFSISYSINQYLITATDKRRSRFLLPLLCIVILISSYGLILLKIHKQQNHQIPYGYCMKKQSDRPEFTVVNNFFVNGVNMNAHINFYKYVLQEKNIHVTIKHSDSLQLNETAMVCEKALYSSISEKYDFLVLDSAADCKMIKILKRK